MTEALSGKTCTPCHGGIPPLTREQAEVFHAQAPDWQLVEEAHRIERSFGFAIFERRLARAQRLCSTQSTFDEFLQNMRPIITKGELTFRSGRTLPNTRPIERFGDIVAHPILGGLHHRYARI
jgi:hypothetical protein